MTFALLCGASSQLAERSGRGLALREEERQVHDLHAGQVCIWWCMLCVLCECLAGGSDRHANPQIIQN